MFVQLRPALMLLVLTAAVTGSASAQTVATTFNELRLKVKPGDTIYVTGTNLPEARARLLEVSSSSLVVSMADNRQVLDESYVMRIRQRVADPVWNGAAIGAAAYVTLAGIIVSIVGDTGCSASCWTVNGLMSITIGGLIGAGVDSLIQSRATIYERESGPSSARVRVGPLLSPRVKGLSGTIEW